MRYSTTRSVGMLSSMPFTWSIWSWVGRFVVEEEVEVEDEEVEE
jgi:hypothetical protein